MKYKYIFITIAVLLALVAIICFMSKEVPTNVMKTPQFDETVEKAKHGDKDACWNLYLHYDEIGDKDKTLYWLNQGSSFGDARAQYQLFAMLKDSHDANEKRKALQELEKSANNNYSFAQLEFGKEYRNGGIIPVDNEKAKYWLRKAALHSEIAAMLQLADIYRKVDHALVKAYAWTILAKNTVKTNRAYDEEINNTQKNIIKDAEDHKINIEVLLRQAEVESKEYKRAIEIE